MSKFTEKDIQTTANTLTTIRAMLATVPEDLLKEMIESINRQEAFGCFFDPTRWQQTDWNAMHFTRDVARKLIELKKLWSGDEELLGIRHSTEGQ